MRLIRGCLIICASRPDTLAGLQPLYQAVTHGCLAGRQQEACVDVYRDRIKRGAEAYSSKKLGAFGANLGAVATFFDQPWSRLSPNLSEPEQSWLLSEAAFRLRALGRLTEAVEPMRVSGEMDVKSEEWKGAAISYSNLNELELTLGMLDAAVADGRRAVEYADRREDAFQKIVNRTAAAALHQRGELDSPQHREARDLFVQAEQMQAERQPQFPLLYSLQGFKYVDLILAPAERATWQCILHQPPGASPRFRDSFADNNTDAPGQEPDASAWRLMADEKKAVLAACDEATRRATQTLEWATRNKLSLLTIALDHLSLARASLYRAILESEPHAVRASEPVSGKALAAGDTPENAAENRRLAPGRSQDKPPDADTSLWDVATSELHQALNGLRKAGDVEFVVRARLTAAMLESLRGGDGIDRALAHLDEAQQIATRGPMPLYLADIHLTRARVAGRLRGEVGSLKIDAKAELVEARRLIEKHHYHRRLPELRDAEAALL